MKKLMMGIMFLGIATVLAAPASAGYLLIDDFNDQNTTSSLLMSDDETYGSWSVSTGDMEFAEVGGGRQRQLCDSPG